METFYYGGIEDSLFTIVPIIIIIGFILVFGLIAFHAVQGAIQWKENNESPVLTVEATLVTKRDEIHRHHHTENDQLMSTTYSNYYATFQLESGDRMEFQINGKEYGLLVEKDFGKLTFQGTRYLGFERINKTITE